MADDARAHPGEPPPEPDPALRRLAHLVGTWRVADGAPGQVTYEWPDGGLFLGQRVDLEPGGERMIGLEVIGRERPSGAPGPGADSTSRYDDDHGGALDYVDELDGDVLTVWAGERGSPADHGGRFGADGGTLAGDREYPGGGYESPATTVR
jgi:hypothetical protein